MDRRQIIFYDSENNLFLFQFGDKSFIGSSVAGCVEMSSTQHAQDMMDLTLNFKLDDDLPKKTIEDALKVLQVVMLNFKETHIDSKKT